APDADIVKRTSAGVDRGGDRPHDGESQEEGDRREEQPLPACIGKVLTVDGTRGAERNFRTSVRGGLCPHRARPGPPSSPLRSAVLTTRAKTTAVVPTPIAIATLAGRLTAAW